MKTNKEGKNKGIFQKFKVERMDGSSAPGCKHEKCRYFVLDIDHDPHAPAAIRAYTNSCRSDNPELAADLDALFLNISPPHSNQSQVTQYPCGEEG